MNPTSMQEMSPLLLTRNRLPPFPLTKSISASIIVADSSLKNATGPAPTPKPDSRVAKRPIVPQSDPASNTIKYPLFCSFFIFTKSPFPFTQIMRALVIPLIIFIYIIACQAKLVVFYYTTKKQLCGKVRKFIYPDRGYIIIVTELRNLRCSGRQDVRGGQEMDG